MKATEHIPTIGNDLDAQAALWIVKLERGLSEEEAHDLEVWLSASPAHSDCFLHYAESWEKTEALSSLADLFPRARPHSLAPERRRLIGGLSGAIAASLVLVAVVTFFSNPAAQKPPSTLSYETAIGGLSRVALSDGSVLTLNTNTKVDVTIGPETRRLQLEFGEIHIDVEKDPSRPLIVEAGGTVFEAVGTEFNIRIDESQHVELLVTEGLVRVGVAAKALFSSEEIAPSRIDDLLVSQGERVRLKGIDRAVETVPEIDIEVELSWQQGNLIFRGEPLSEAVAEISRYTSVEFVIVDENLKAIRVAGLFKSGDVAGFLDSLEANFDIKHERLGNQTFLKAR